MNLPPDDPRLSAWVLGELPPDEAEAVGRAVESDPELRAQAEELRGMSEFLSASLAAASLQAHQREAVRRAGRTTEPARNNLVEFPVAKPQKRRLPWPLILGVAATVTFAAYLTFSPGRAPEGLPDQAVSGGEEKAAPPYAGPRISTAPSPGQSRPQRDAAPLLDQMARDLAANGLPEPSRLPPPMPLPEMRSASEVDLPVLVGRESYDSVRGWIRQKGQLPPKDAVRIEELANAFPLPAAEETREFAGLKVACVSMASMWSGPGRLVGVQISNESGRSRQVEWSFSPAPGAREGGVRVLASTSGSGAKEAILPPGRRTLVLIELASATDDAGDLVVASAGRKKRFPALETKDPALKQAGLVAAFGIWLRGEGIDDSRLNQILASAEKDNSTSTPEWTDSRKLVREALDIAEKKRRK
ncbi:von Willebrand factor type A domain-containing protein [Haloferula sp. BvORR071]|uniref:VWA domain-containing protein n=1 Tax=Haloferula sp. BvORR071 TaxID=1396141 RepID=UPI00054DD857|nr:von Willebrand factor type A domain-containing protein [Haloferula sp. BvORR071]